MCISLNRFQCCFAVVVVADRLRASGEATASLFENNNNDDRAGGRLADDTQAMTTSSPTEGRLYPQLRVRLARTMCAYDKNSLARTPPGALPSRRIRMREGKFELRGRF